MTEQLRTEIAHGALAYIHHHPVIGIGAEYTDDIGGRHGKQCRRQCRIVGYLTLGQRNDVIVYKALHKQHSAEGSQCGAQDTNYYYKKGKFIIFEHIAQHPSHGMKLLACTHFAVFL